MRRQNTETTETATAREGAQRKGRLVMSTRRRRIRWDQPKAGGGTIFSKLLGMASQRTMVLASFSKVIAIK